MDLYQPAHPVRRSIVVVIAAFVAMIASTVIISTSADGRPPDNDATRAGVAMLITPTPSVTATPAVGDPAACANLNQLEVRPRRMSTSSNYNGRFTGMNAIDGDSSTQWISKPWQPSAWITVAPVLSGNVTNYAISFANGSALTSRSPADWQLLGSNDGDTWTPLDKRSDQSEWAGSETRMFTIGEPGDYQWYRLEVLQDHDSRADLVVASIAEFVLFDGCEIVDPPLPPCILGNTVAVTPLWPDSSGNYSSSYPGSAAFDFDPSTRWLSSTWQPEPWIQAEIDGQPTTVTGYAIQFTNGPSLTTRAPSWWNLLGSNDGVTWSLVDGRTGETDWAGSETRSFDVALPADYAYLRLQVREDNDPRADVVVASISELRFFSGCQMDPNIGVGLHGLGVGEGVVVTPTATVTPTPTPTPTPTVWINEW